MKPKVSLYGEEAIVKAAIGRTTSYYRQLGKGNPCNGHFTSWGRWQVFLLCKRGNFYFRSCD
jgi:hypothetical protein